MSQARYPADLVVTQADFESSGWNTVLEDVPSPRYADMWHNFAKAAEEAAEAGTPAKCKVLWLLADACSMMLRPESPNEPFHPCMVLLDKRSAQPTDFTVQDITFFSEIAGSINHALLRARLADIVWLRRQPRRLSDAITAIDAYTTQPLDPQTWARDGGPCWKRATSLAKMAGKDARNRVDAIASSVTSSCLAATSKSKYFALFLADLLIDQTLISRDDAATIATHLASIGHSLLKQGDLHRCCDYFDRAHRLHHQLGESDLSADMLCAHANARSQQGDAEESRFAAGAHYEKAIQLYRQVPRARRPSRNVDAIIADLHDRLSEAGEASLDEMGIISTDGIDISGMVASAADAVRDRPADEALARFVALHRVDVDQVRRSSLDSIRTHPLLHLFPLATIGGDGRVIAKKPGVDLADGASGANDKAVWAEMIAQHGRLADIAVQAFILPAFRVLLLQHRLRLEDFCAVTSHSSIVPPDRSESFARALFAGYERDFVAMIHILAPQVEHMARYHLKEAGVKTTTLDLHGIEMECGLSTLAVIPEMETIFGPDLTFEIRALYCEPSGPNLRNQVAHGLLTPQACHSTHCIYAWWLALRMIYIPFWNAQRPKPRPAASSGGTP